MNNELHILGCGSALPTFQNSPACQVIELCDKSLMIDCGEGSQIWLRRMALRTARLYNVFISHLHGDHCFGLIGLISTFGMMGRTQPLHIYAHPDLERLLQPWLDYHCEGMSYEVIFHPINPRKSEVIYEDRTLTVTTIPLKHKVPTCGFLFTERHRDKEPVKRYACRCLDLRVGLVYNSVDFCCDLHILILPFIVLLIYHQPRTYPRFRPRTVPAHILPSI